ncbi:MAG TPA: histidine kinase, partial [Solirubrobacter sp.]|nr:histidine kinase [Solirubrobacter sp.]
CEDRGVDRRIVLAGLAVPAAALAVLALAEARQHPDLAPGGASAAAAAIQLATVFALAAGAVHAARRDEAALAGALLVALAGLALHTLPVPDVGAALFTLALIGAAVPAAAAAHAALLHPGGHLVGALDRVAIAAGYVVTVGLLGLAVAVVFDPPQAGCYACPENLALVDGDLQAHAWLVRWMPRLAAVAAVALAVLVVIRLLRRPAAARSLAAPVTAAAVAVLALAAVANVRASDGPEAAEIDRALWLATVASLGLLAAGLAWRPLRTLRTRAALGRIAGAATGPAGVRVALGRALGDPAVEILFPHPESGAPTTLDGAPAPDRAASGRARTAVERRGQVVAWVEHAAGVRATPELLASTVRAAAPTVEREALLATQRLQAEELQESTLRLVSAGDAERRRLERDLHDGAQQRLLALGLELARGRAAAPAHTAATLRRAETRVTAIREHLREIAHGIHSVTLAEGGLAEAVLALVQASDHRVVIEALSAARAPVEAEAAVYRVVAAALQFDGTDARIGIRILAGELDAVVHVSGIDPEDLADALAHAGARVTSLRGALSVVAADGGATAHARVPLA